MVIDVTDVVIDVTDVFCSHRVVRVVPKDGTGCTIGWNNVFQVVEQVVPGLGTRSEVVGCLVVGEVQVVRVAILGEIKKSSVLQVFHL